MNYYKIKSYAKINLALNITGKKYYSHKIESIISFLDLYDEILIKRIKNKNHKIKFVGKFANKIYFNNTVSKLIKILEKKKFLSNKKFKIIIRKNIPSRAGLGGGSVNAASILYFLIKKRFIKVSKKDVLKITSLIGSDVILGMYSKNLILKSNNTIKEFNIKKKIYTLLVKPGFGCSTKKIYSEVKHFRKAIFTKPTKKMFDIDFLKKMKNDLELIVFKKYKSLSTLKNFLENLTRVEFVRMTGSGSTIIAYFKSYKMCKQAEKKVKKHFRNYWSKTAKTI